MKNQVFKIYREIMLYAAAFGRLVFECTKTKGSGDVEREGE